MDFKLSDVQRIATTFDQAVPTGNEFLDARYQNHINVFGHPQPYYRLFYRLGELLRPDMVLELGAWQGTGAAHWAPHSGIVATIDHHSDPGDDENQRLCLEAQQRFFNLHYIQGWTWDVVGQVRALGKYIRVLFIDSWHHYDKAMRDWDSYREMLDPKGALVICDDLSADDFSTISGMMRFWEEISAGRERFLVDPPVSTFPMGFFKWEGIS